MVTPIAFRVLHLGVVALIAGSWLTACGRTRFVPVVDASVDKGAYAPNLLDATDDLDGGNGLPEVLLPDATDVPTDPAGTPDGPEDSPGDVPRDGRFPPDTSDVPKDGPPNMPEAPPIELRLVAGAVGGSGNLDGVGTRARFGCPLHAAYDGVGSLFVTDSVSDLDINTIRKIDLATGTVTTFAGTPGPSGTGSADGIGNAAKFQSPSGITSDGAGALYVTEMGNQTIRRIDIATRAVSTLLTAPPIFDDAGVQMPIGPAGVVFDGAGHLFFADSGGHTIRRVDIATKTMTIIAGAVTVWGSSDGIGPAATFSYPSAVALDGQGNLFVADEYSHAIRKIDLATAEVTTFVGSANSKGVVDGTGETARFDLPLNLVYDGAGTLYVSDTGTVRSVDIATKTVKTIAGSADSFDSVDGTGLAARFYSPYGLALDGKGNLFVVDAGNLNVRKIELATATVTTVAGTARPFGSVDGIAGRARFSNPTGIANDGKGHLLIADSFNSVIRKLDTATGAVSTLAGNPKKTGFGDGTGDQALFDSPWTVASDRAGHLFVSEWNNYAIRQVDIATGKVTTIAGSAQQSGSDDGIGTAALFGPQAKGLAVDDAGNLFVADGVNYTIRKVDLSTAAVSTFAGLTGSRGSADGTGANARFRTLGGLAYGGGSLWAGDGCTVRKVSTTTGQVTTVAGSPDDCGATDGVGSAAKLSYPIGLVADGKGSLYFSDTRNNAVRRIDLSTWAVTTFVGGFGQAGVVLGPLPALLNTPQGLAIGSAGELYIVDEGAVLVVK